MKRRAFTLVELLVVLGIITVLIGLILPGTARVREKVRLVQCHNNLRQIYTLYEAYANENRGRFADKATLGIHQFRRGAGVVDPANGLPETLGLPALLAGKGMPGKNSIWMCPAMPDVYLPNGGASINFREYGNTYAFSTSTDINSSPLKRMEKSWVPKTGVFADQKVAELLVWDNWNQCVAEPVANYKDAKRPKPQSFTPFLKPHFFASRQPAVNMLLLDGSVGLW